MNPTMCMIFVRILPIFYGQGSYGEEQKRVSWKQNRHWSENWLLSLFMEPGRHVIPWLRILISRCMYLCDWRNEVYTDPWRIEDGICCIVSTSHLPWAYISLNSCSWKINITLNTSRNTVNVHVNICKALRWSLEAPFLTESYDREKAAPLIFLMAAWKMVVLWNRPHHAWQQTRGSGELDLTLLWTVYHLYSVTASCGRKHGSSGRNWHLSCSPCQTAQ